MSTQLQPALPFTAQKIEQHRGTKRGQIHAYFMDHLGELISSRAAHMKWGSSFRTRVSEINRNTYGDSEIFINNEVKFAEGVEQSVYWGTRR